MILFFDEIKNFSKTSLNPKPSKIKQNKIANFIPILQIRPTNHHGAHTHRNHQVNHFCLLPSDGSAERNIQTFLQIYFEASKKYFNLDINQRCWSFPPQGFFRFVTAVIIIKISFASYTQWRLHARRLSNIAPLISLYISVSFYVPLMKMLWHFLMIFKRAPMLSEKGWILCDNDALL